VRSSASIAFRAALVVLGLGAAACTGSRPAPPAVPFKPLRPATLEQVRAAYDAYCESTTTVSASGDVDVRDRRTGKGRTLGVRLVATRGGKLYLKGSVAVITAIDSKAIDSATTLTNVMDTHHPGDQLTLTVTDGSGAQQQVPVKAIEGPVG